MMKRMFVVLAMVPMLAQAAELSAGTIEITGGSGLGFAAGSEEEKGVADKTKTTQVGLDVAGLYYVTPMIGVGLKAGYSLDSSKVVDVKDSTSALFIGPAVGIDYAVAEKAAVFAVANVGYATGTRTHEEPGLPKSDASASGPAFGLEVGAKYFVSKSFSINGSVGYDWMKLTGDAPPGGGEKPETTFSDFGVNVGLSVYFGQ